VADYPLSDETYRIIGACFEVYNEKGCGFLEPIYQECLEMEFGLQGIPFNAQVELILDYKGRRLQKKYVPDFICFGGVIVEIKACKEIVAEHRAQLINYLHATEMKVGMLVNFGHYPGLQFERFVNEGKERTAGRAMVREIPLVWGQGSLPADDTDVR